jgi:predicted TPR repeat methyltransferase
MTQVALEVPDAQTALDSLDRWAAAEAELALLLAAGISKAQAVARWGMQLLKASRSLDAITALRVAVALSPDEAASWTHLGIALDRAQSTQAAATCYERSVTLSRKQPHTWLLLGLARKKLSDFCGAETAYRVAIEQDETSAVVWQCLGLLKEEQRDYAGAIECFSTCAKYGAPSAAISANLGKLNYQLGKIPDAHEAFASAVTLDPSNSHYAQMLGKTQFLLDVIAGKSADQALEVFQHTVPTVDRADQSAETTLDRWLDVASGILSSFGQIEPAVRLARKRLELDPKSATAQYLLDALLCKPDVNRSPAAYIVENFDAFAAGFDAKLVGVLGYDVPEKLCSAVRAGTPEGHLYDALDAGCGTGLCGPLLRPLVRRLTGVDLSSKMLERAAERRVYDALVCEDLVAFLGHHERERRFDLIVAADVLNYFGDLASLFPLAAAAISSGGLFAFSVELFGGEGYWLQPSGRFAHAPAYVRSVAGPEFVEEGFVDTTIRLEASGRVLGNLFVFRRR